METSITLFSCIPVFFPVFIAIYLIAFSISAFSYISIFFPSFIAVYLIAYFGVFRHWSPKYRPEASSCSISFAHGTPAACMALAAIKYPSQWIFASPNTNFQNLVLDYSISYFLIDLLHYIVFFPSDYLFIAHHVATLFVFVTCRYLAFHGAFAILILLFLAEVTSFCQNVWTLANTRKANSPTAAKVYKFFSLPFYVVYTIARGFLGPLFVFKMGLYYLSGDADEVIPRWVYISWIVVIVPAILASLLWILNLWVDFIQEWIGRVDKKTR